MSTRCNVVVKDRWYELWFYRHSDGYPSVAVKSLKKFLRWLIDGKIRDNATQASGWLILMGAEEYLIETKYEDGAFSTSPKPTLTEPLGGLDGWKCGAYEPTKGEHGDIEYLYIIDLQAKEILCCRPGQRAAPFYRVTAANIDKPIAKNLGVQR